MPIFQDIESPLIEKLKTYNVEVQRKCSQLVDVRKGPFESTATFTGLVYSFFTARSRGRTRISFYTKVRRRKKSKLQAPHFVEHSVFPLKYSTFRKT